MIDMTALAYGDRNPGVFPSVGACDEFLRLFVLQKRVTPAEIAELEGKLTGLREHGEVIALQVVPYDDVWQMCPDGKTLASLFLYEKLKAAGKIPDLTA